MEQNYKKIIIALAAVAVVLLGVLIYVFVDRNSIINATPVTISGFIIGIFATDSNVWR